MKVFFNTFALDTKIAWRNWFLVITIALAILYSVLVNWAVPAKIEMPKPAMIFFDNTSSGIWSNFLKQYDTNPIIASSYEEFEKMTRDRNTIGIMFDENEIQILRQGYEDDKTINLLKTTLLNSYNIINTGQLPQNIEVVQLQEKEKILAFNIRIIPTLLATDIVILGFLFISVMIFNDKKEKSILAYKVSPGGVFNYLMSKILVNTTICVFFAFIFIILTGQIQINLFYYFLLIFSSAFFMSTLGILLGQFFDSVSEFLYIIMGICFVASLPAMQYFNPLFSFDFFKLIPSYSVIYGVHWLIEGSAKNILPLIGIVFLEILIIFPITYFSFKRRRF